MAKKVKIELDFDTGDFVYLITDPDQIRRMVTEVKLLPGGVALYVVGYSDNETSEHYSIELSDTKNVIEFNNSKSEDEK